MEYDLEELGELLPAVQLWAQRHPRPDDVLVRFAAGYQLTAREIAEGLEMLRIEPHQPEPALAAFLGILTHGVRHHPRDHLIRGFLYAGERRGRRLGSRGDEAPPGPLAGR